MVLPRTSVLAVVLVALLAGVGSTAAAAPTTLQQDQADGQTSDAGGAASCDYAALYEETIDSVVSVQAQGGLGSGFAYQVRENDSTSYLVTNAHVVRGAGSLETPRADGGAVDRDEVLVQFARGESREGEVVGSDTAVDLAVVRVNETPEYVEALSVANETPTEGTKVAALGNPFGLDQTITHGIVSGVNRSMPTRQGFTIPNVVQTDAPINPGSSGGPLVTCDGTVVGVNTAGIGAGLAENVGFAVSATSLERVGPALIERGEYEHAYLGVRTVPVTPQLLAANDLNATGGVYVHEVPEDGPASGVLQGSDRIAIEDGAPVPVGGDLIVAIDDRQVGDGEELSSYLMAETRPGEEVTLTILRDGERRQVTVTLEERPEPTAGGIASQRP